MSHYDAVLAAFRASPVRGRADDFRGYCPWHKGGAERTPSVSLRIRGGVMIVHCFVCGREATPLLMRAAGLSMSHLFPDHGERKDRPMALQSVATYTYADESGNPLYRSVRFKLDGGGKTFMQERYSPSDGRWLPGIGSEPGVPGAQTTTRRVIYNLPLVVASPGQPVCVVEGEKCADALTALGLVATTNVGGVGMGWADAYSESLRGRRVAVFPDNDPPGFRHAERVLGSLVRHGAEAVRLVLLPGLPAGGDVVDWLEAGGTRGSLLEVIRATPEWRARP